MAQTSALQQQIENVLKGILEPDLNEDLWTLGMIQNLEITAHGDSSQVQPTYQVRLTLILSSPAVSHRESLPEKVGAELRKISGIKQVQVDVHADAAFRAHQKKQVHQAPLSGVANIIAVSSGKGGVGKSTVAANLAAALMLEGCQIGLLDADIYGPSLPTMLGVHGIPEMMKHETRGELFVPPMAHGMQVMSMGLLVNDDQAMLWRGPMLHKALQQFLFQTDWGSLDYLILDLPPGTGDVQLSIAQMVPLTGAVVVTTPQEIAVQDVRKACQMFKSVKVPILGIVENMSYFEPSDLPGKRYPIFGEGGGAQLAEQYRTELLAQLPIEMGVRSGGDQGLPVVIRQPNTPVAELFRRFASRVVSRISQSVNHRFSPDSIVEFGLD